MSDNEYTTAPRSKRKKLILVFAAALVCTLAGLAVADQPTPRTIGEDSTDVPDGSACLSGIAIDVTVGMIDDASESDHGLAMVCTSYCEADYDCPEGWGCRRVPQPKGRQIHLCFPLRG